jgi:nucleoside-diphosphate-sugar epimerase
MNLVTGATGHIGNVLVRQLLARGEQVRVIVRQGSDLRPLEGLEVEMVHGDLLDSASLRQAVEGVELVYHLAARINLTSRPDPEIGRVNVDGTRHLLASALETRVRRFIFASSVYALQLPQAGTVDENLPFDPSVTRGEYYSSKAAASLAVLDAVAQGLDAVLLCPTAVTGPFDFQYSEAGRGILYNMTPGIKFTVDGAYDFVDVRDVACGFIQAAERGRRGETYILGGNRLTVVEASNLIWESAGGRHMGIHLPNWVADLGAVILPLFSNHPLVTPSALDAIRSNSNISHAKAARELGYQPRPAARAIVDAVYWWQERIGEFMPEKSGGNTFSKP